VPVTRENAKFVEPMLLLAGETLPKGPGWTYELKLDGYRAIAMKTGGEVRLRSRNDKYFNGKYPGIPTLSVTRVIEAVQLTIDGKAERGSVAAGRQGYSTRSRMEIHRRLRTQRG
jgi:ATP-dependent DNA ligase